MCVPYCPFSELVEGAVFEFHPCCPIESIGLSGKTVFIRLGRNTCKPIDSSETYTVDDEYIHSTRVTVIIPDRSHRGLV